MPRRIMAAGSIPSSRLSGRRSASTTNPAKATGVQYAGKDQPLQVDVHWTFLRRRASRSSLDAIADDSSVYSAFFSRSPRPPGGIVGALSQGSQSA